MIMKKMYPVIFTQTKDCVLVEVPDLEILTEGKDIESAIEMARDAISVTIVSMEDNDEYIPAPSKMSEIDITNSTFFRSGESFLSLVDTDVNEYRKKIETKPVRRNVSLPSWLNHAADTAGINVSKVLQEALISVLGITRKY